MTVTRTVDPSYLRRLCHDVLQRSPTPLEARAYLGMPVERAAQTLATTREAREAWLEEELFHYLLIDRFRPRTAAIEALPARLDAGRITIRDATAEILLSTAFSLRNPGNDTFVTVVLEQCLGMAVQERANRATLEAGKRLYDGEPATFLGRTGRSQADIVAIVVAHEDFARHQLERHHRRLFGEPFVAGRRPTEEQQACIDRLHGDPRAFDAILVRWLGSERYVAACAVRKRRNDRQFVRSLYVDVLGRPPTYDEMRNMRNALQSMADSTPLRAVMAKLIVDSQEAVLPECRDGEEAAFVATCFRRYLGREPRATELQDFLAVLQEPDTEPRHVVRALLCSAEYHYY